MSSTQRSMQRASSQTLSAGRSANGGMACQIRPRASCTFSLDLTFLPARGRGAERGLEQVVAGHGGKASVDLPCLARADTIDCRPHVVENAAARHTTQHAKCLGQGIEQHLVGLQPVGPDHESPAVRQLGVGCLQLDPLACDRRPILAPVELERLAGLEGERHEHAPSGGPLRDLPPRPPLADEGGHPGVGTVVAKNDQVSMKPPRVSTRLATLARLDPQPLRQFVGKRVQAAGPLRHLEFHLDGI